MSWRWPALAILLCVANNAMAAALDRRHQARPRRSHADTATALAAPERRGRSANTDLDKPALWVFLPASDKANGTAVVVCPGGGYQRLAIGHEGKDVADWFNSQGIAAFVLRYRLGPTYHHPTR